MFFGAGPRGLSGAARYYTPRYIYSPSPPRSPSLPSPSRPSRPRVCRATARRICLLLHHHHSGNSGSLFSTSHSSSLDSLPSPLFPLPTRPQTDSTNCPSTRSTRATKCPLQTYISTNISRLTPFRDASSCDQGARSVVQVVLASPRVSTVPRGCLLESRVPIECTHTLSRTARARLTTKHYEVRILRRATNTADLRDGIGRRYPDVTSLREHDNVRRTTSQSRRVESRTT